MWPSNPETGTASQGESIDEALANLPRGDIFVSRGVFPLVLTGSPTGQRCLQYFLPIPETSAPSGRRSIRALDAWGSALSGKKRATWVMRLR